MDGSGGGIWTDRFGYGQKGFERKEGESDVDFQKRWNEERIERRLRGAMISSFLTINEVLDRGR